MRFGALFLASLLAFGVACSSSDSPGTPTSTSTGVGGGLPAGDLADAIIGPAGGTLVASDGSVALRIPSGALTTPIALYLRASTTAPTQHLGTAYEIGPSGLQFAVPATLLIHYDPALLGGAPEADLQAATAVGSTWAPLAEQIVDTTARTVSGVVPDVGIFGVILADGGAGGSGGGGGGGGGAGGGGGSCATPCSAVAPSTATCVDDRCVVDVAETLGDADLHDIVLAHDDVYWIDTSVGCELHAAPADGGATRDPVLLDGPDGCTCPIGGAFLTADATRLYWAGGGICAMPLTGTTPTVLVPSAEVDGIAGLALTSTDVVWVDAATGVASAPLAGGAMTPLALVSGVGAFAFADDHDVYWFDAASDPRIASPVTAHAVPLPTGAVEKLASGLPAVGAAAFSGGALFVVATGTTIAKVGTGGGAAQVLYTAAAGSAIPAIAADATQVYWIEQAETTLRLRRMAGGGTGIVTLLTRATAAGATVTGLALDATRAAWTEVDSPTRARIMTLTPR